jgi:hypothetical protein
MQITPNMPQIIVNLVQFLNKLNKFNVPFFATPIQANYNIIAKTVRKYYDKEGKEYDSTILEHINRNDGRMDSAYAALLRRNLIVAPDEWDLTKINDLSYKIKQVLNFLNHITTGKYSEDTVVYYESRESRGKIMDNKSKLIYLHVPTMIKIVIDPTPNPKSNLCDIVTCYTLNGYSSIQNEFINCTIPYGSLDLDTLFKCDEDSRTWKNFVADAMRIGVKKAISKQIVKKKVILPSKSTNSKPSVVSPKIQNCDENIKLNLDNIMKGNRLYSPRITGVYSDLNEFEYFTFFIGNQGLANIAKIYEPIELFSINEK